MSNAFKETRFHTSDRCLKNGKKASHHILESLPDVMKVLRNNPDFGRVVPGTQGLRKMRLRARDLNCGKSGGYRLIYRKIEDEEIIYIVFLAVYFKGDKDDLSAAEYGVIDMESESIFNNSLQIEWIAPKAHE